jgi:ribosomal protein S18 acetylase RimI-like enzyme
MQFARESGLQIKLEVHKNNAIARQLYEKYGFKFLGDYDVFIVREY